MTPVFPHCTSADLPAATKTSFLPKQRRDGCEKRREGLVKGPGEGAEEEGRIGRRQGQEEEVVQGQDEGQAEQPGPLRQGYLRQAHEGGALLQLITPSIVSERMKVRGSLARKALQELQTKGLIRQVVKHRSQLIYTRVTKEEDDAEEAKDGKK